MPEEMTEIESQAHAQSNSDGIIADAKWLGGKALAGAKAVGGAIDSAYDATKAGFKKVGSAVVNAPGAIARRGDKWLKDHNFKKAQVGSSAKRAHVGSQVGASSKGKMIDFVNGMTEMCPKCI